MKWAYHECGQGTRLDPPIDVSWLALDFDIIAYISPVKDSSLLEDTVHMFTLFMLRSFCDNSWGFGRWTGFLIVM
jgi:hypothetical protein